MEGERLIQRGRTVGMRKIVSESILHPAGAELGFPGRGDYYKDGGKEES